MSCIAVVVQQQGRTVKRVIARIAGRQHGIVTRRELLGAGITPEQIRQRLDRGALFRVYRGVYSVGRPVGSVEARYMAAVKACGKGALLAGRAAAHLLSLLEGPAPAPEVITPTQRRVKGIRTRRCRHSTMPGKTRVRGIAVTSAAETLVDLAPDLGPDELALACHKAGVRYKTTPRQVQAVLHRRPRAPGAGKLRRVLGGDARATLSELERGFLALLRRHGLPLPEVNRPADGRRVDCRWPGKLPVELDSYRFHNSRHAWKQDHLRNRAAHARQEQLRRYIWEDVFDTGDRTAAEVRALIS